MSTVELAVKKVRKLSARQAQELLDWLAKRQSNGNSPRKSSPASRRKPKSRRSAQTLLAWYDSIRGSTDWQPPRMPDDLITSVRL